MTSPMKMLFVVVALAATPRLAHADGMPMCKTDGTGACDAGSGGKALSVGTSLAIMGLVAYAIGRKRNR